MHKIYVDPDVHGKGLGSLFLTHIEQQCQLLDYREVILQVNKNNTKAIKAYRRNGYVVKKDLVVDIGKGFVMDDYLMAKLLN